MATSARFIDHAVLDRQSLIHFSAGWAALRRIDWFVSPGRQGYLVMLAVGLVIGVVVEWTAVHVMGRWAYAPRMPVIFKEKHYV